jgi:hypothetical protein
MAALKFLPMPNPDDLRREQSNSRWANFYFYFFLAWGNRDLTISGLRLLEATQSMYFI